MVSELRSIALTTPADIVQSVHTTQIQPTTIPSTFAPSTSTSSTSIQSPLLLLSNTNYIPWKHQLITILEAYSLVEHIDDTTPKPLPFALDAAGNATSVANPEFQAWNINDKTLLSLIN